MRESMLDTSGGVCYVLDAEGPGRPLLVLHGGLGLDHSYLRDAFDLLSDSYRVIYLDFLGNGRSTRAIDFDAIDSNSIWVQQVADVISRLDLHQPVIAGHSYGGYVALEFAISHQTPGLELLLLSTAPKLAHLDLALRNAKARGTDDAIRAVEEDLTKAQSSDDAWARTWRRLLPLYFHDPNDDILDDMVAQGVFSAAAFNTAHLRALKNYDVTPALGTIQARSLVVCGDDDWILPLDPCSLTLARRIPRADLAVLPATGHFPFIERPMAFNSVVKEWLDARA